MLSGFWIVGLLSICVNRELFCSFAVLNTPKYVKIGNGAALKALGQGNVCILAYNGKTFHTVTLHDVLFVPDLKINLFSQLKALDRGLCQMLKKLILKTKRISL